MASPVAIPLLIALMTAKKTHRIFLDGFSKDHETVDVFIVIE